MSFSWRRNDRLINRRVWVHFPSGFVSLRVPFWMPITAIIRDAKEAFVGNAEPERIVEDDGRVLWKAEGAPDALPYPTLPRMLAER